ncbi:uncharacterized protein BJ171DRAFT_87834 [Polychytrium aggregatum]|uniref:uncharacterized protein n=1 Tax=Polychytrium aggregatum TaxID=110093 RepID=UPI0022FDE406|nr:uncharacterized protein BJ171DRAFT_87834 [Polychytrium aggregatum]KAI9190547.1 hypothetical protein BJ171DRAFT_87834 [Polychytrium aggregatum]
MEITGMASTPFAAVPGMIGGTSGGKSTPYRSDSCWWVLAGWNLARRFWRDSWPINSARSEGADCSPGSWAAANLKTVTLHVPFAETKNDNHNHAPPGLRPLAHCPLPTPYCLFYGLYYHYLHCLYYLYCLLSSGTNHPIHRIPRLLRVARHYRRLKTFLPIHGTSETIPVSIDPLEHRSRHQDHQARYSPDSNGNHSWNMTLLI